MDEQQPESSTTETAPESQINNSESMSDSELWDSVGFHRPLAGFWYKLGFMIVHIIGGILVAALVYPLMFPYPEIDGYYRTGTNLFVALFVAFDLGTANIMNRFIGETGIKNPKKMVEYLQYFIWYQMFSGLIQLTMIAVWILYLPPQELIYLSWIFLIYSTTQYPAMQSVFRNALSAMQQFDKSATLGFLESDVIQKLSEIFFVLLFRYTLGQNPAYKIILAMAIGLVLGKYLDDFIVMGFGIKFFNTALQKYGISARVCFRHDFDWKLFKETFIFGVKTGLPGAISSFVGLIILIWWLNVPQYTSFIALLGLAESIINFIRGLQLELGGAISESYLNGKKALCQYYIGQTWRFDSLIQLLMYSIIFGVTLVLAPTLVAIGLGYYLLSIPFIFPVMIRRFFMPYESLAGGIITGTNHATTNFIIEMITLTINFITWWLYLIVFKIPQNYGITAVVWIMPLGDLPGVFFRLIISYRFVHRKIVPLKIPLWQAFVGPSVAGFIFGLMGWVYVQIIFLPMLALWGIIPALIPMIIIFVFIGPFMIYTPITVLMGAWDDTSVDSFRKAAIMAGFARFIVSPMYKMILKTIPYAKWHNKFGVDEKEALKEARELMEMKVKLKEAVE
jgi:hypothetical protein